MRLPPAFRLAFLLAFSLAACGTPATRSNATVVQDGSFVLRYQASRDAVFHAALAACSALDYEPDVVDPLAARITAHSQTKRRGLGAQVQYYVLRADVEAPSPGIAGVRVRLTITFTHHLSGQPRTSMNDSAVGSRERYDDFFNAIHTALAK
jgi:hypothetical protein